MTFAWVQVSPDRYQTTGSFTPSVGGQTGATVGYLTEAANTAEEEVLGCFVEDRAADDLLATGGGDEFAREERAEDTGGVDAADLGDFWGGNRLLVGDDGKGFERL